MAAARQNRIKALIGPFQRVVSILRIMGKGQEEVFEVPRVKEDSAVEHLLKPDTELFGGGVTERRPLIADRCVSEPHLEDRAEANH